mmetsp:Transcript_116617/g.370934  ORF Transcript_116617/g.370934 Transcript_116617/m.370934 type:complete len:432 (-) Transcript_116617:82-1377(-)
MFELETTATLRHTMRAQAQCQICAVEESLSDILTERHGDPPSGGLAGARSVVRVSPLSVEDDFLVLGPLLAFCELLIRQRVRVVSPPRRLRKCTQTLKVHLPVAEQAPMHHEDLLLHHCKERQQLEDPLKGSQKRAAVLRQTLLREAASHLQGPRDHLFVLVVSAENINALRVPQLERDDEQPNLHGVSPTVYDVPVEEVHHRLRRHAVGLEDVQHVKQLAMRISDDNEPWIFGCRGPRQLEVDHGRGETSQKLPELRHHTLGNVRRDGSLVDIPPQRLEQLVRVDIYLGLQVFVRLRQRPTEAVAGTQRPRLVGTARRRRRCRHLKGLWRGAPKKNTSPAHFLHKLLNDRGPLGQSTHLLALLDAVEDARGARVRDPPWARGQGPGAADRRRRDDASGGPGRGDRRHGMCKRAESLRQHRCIATPSLRTR